MACSSKNRSEGAARFFLSRLPIVAVLLWCASMPLSAHEVTLSTGDRLLLAEYRAIGRPQAPMLVATSPAQTGAVSKALQKWGAQIVSRRDAIGYLYAFVPLHAIGAMTTLKGIEAVQVAVLPVRAGAGCSIGSGGTAAS